MTIIGTAGWPAVILAPFAVAAVGAVCELVLIKRLYREGPLLSLIVTFALALLIEALIRSCWGSMGLSMSPPSFLTGLVEFGPILLTTYRLALLVVTVCLLALLWLFFTRHDFLRAAL